MYKIQQFFVLFFFTPSFLFGKVTPEEGSFLNYRIIGFSVPEKKHTIHYKIQIADGNYSDDKAFEDHIMVTASADKNKIVAEVPDFGKQYTWRISYEDESKVLSAGRLYHFMTMFSSDVDPDGVRMRITCDSGKYKDQYIFVDCNKVLYDMSGKPVWYFPIIENKNPKNIHLRDLTATAFGTITTIANGRLYEMSYTGEILWQAPDNGEISLDTTTQVDGYHHEFIRLANGHYMAMSFEQPWWQLPGPPDSSVFEFLASKIKCENNIYYQKMFFGTIIEYDGDGNIVWKWSDADYFKKSDLSTRMHTAKIFDINDTHANAFYFDEKTQNLYISYREISRILKVQYPSGKILCTYGKPYNPKNVLDRHLANGLFCGQHSCRLSGDGNLYMFNNNTCRGMPTVLIVKQPGPGKNTLEKVWEFECPMEQGDKPVNGLFLFGGNVLELPDHSLFVCMGGSYGKLFIVNMDKQVLWSAQPEKWDTKSGLWIKDGTMIDNKIKEGSYRASIINREELEKLIWCQGK